MCRRTCSALNLVPSLWALVCLFILLNFNVLVFVFLLYSIFFNYLSLEACFFSDDRKRMDGGWGDCGRSNGNQNQNQGIFVRGKKNPLSIKEGEILLTYLRIYSLFFAKKQNQFSCDRQLLGAVESAVSSFLIGHI